MKSDLRNIFMILHDYYFMQVSAKYDVLILAMELVSTVNKFS